MSELQFVVDVPEEHAYLIPLVFSGSQVSSLIRDLNSIVLSLLYSDERFIPRVNKLTIGLKHFKGVAFTSGSAVMLSSEYFDHIYTQSKELHGVLVHELVHVWQSNGQNTLESGVIEGIADYVRLKAGLVPSHWKQIKTGKWNAGYNATGYFLDFVQNQAKIPFVQQLNETMWNQPWDPSIIEKMTGKSVEVWWDLYQKS